MAVEPRKPRKFSTAKIKAHTVYGGCVCVPSALEHCTQEAVGMSVRRWFQQQEMHHVLYMWLLWEQQHFVYTYRGTCMGGSKELSALLIIISTECFMGRALRSLGSRCDPLPLEPFGIRY